MDAKILSTPQELVLIDQVYQNQRVGHRLKSIKPHTADKDDPKLRAACAEMESLFISHLFKEMRATVEKSDFIDGGQAEEIFTSLLDVEMSKKMSTAGGIGLSAILLEQLGAKATKKIP
ncbi:MAG: rod-binding protein [Desulfobacterales bacterium]|jgi:Rod binding domain-containing protein